MGEINTQWEMLFMNYALTKPLYIRTILGQFFETENIRKIYNCLRNNFMESENQAEGFNMTYKEKFLSVRFYYDSDEITDEYLDKILSVDLSQWSDDFIMDKFDPWVKKMLMTYQLMNAYETIQGVKGIDKDSVYNAVGVISDNISDVSSLKLSRGNLGLDMDNPEDHYQNIEYNKIPCGYEPVDQIMGGGFNRKTFNFFAATTGSGKSLIMQNIAVNMANAGYVVVYITLELSEAETIKRMGSMRYNIDIKQYDELSKDKKFMKQKIEENRRENSFLTSNNGKLNIKEYPSGTATISLIDDYCQQYEETTGLEIDALFVDYLQIMDTERGIDRNMLYLKGEHLAVGLRRIAQKRDLVCFSAMQIDKAKYGANSYSLADVSESKAVPDTADSAWAVVLTPQMKVAKKYRWQPLKLRNTETNIEYFEFDYKSSNLRLINCVPILQ